MITHLNEDLNYSSAIEYTVCKPLCDDGFTKYNGRIVVKQPYKSQEKGYLTITLAISGLGVVIKKL